MRLRNAVEAVLFSSDEPVSVEKLADGLGVAPSEVLEAIRELERDYADRGICVMRVGGGFAIVARPEYAEAVWKTLGKRTQMNLSRGALETLAIIAYRQPVTRQDVEAIRGVNSEASIETLLEKGLIREVGRKNVLGRPKLYGTTDEFLKKTLLNSLEELPPL